MSLSIYKILWFDRTFEEKVMKNACFIVSYFGELPNTFPIWLHTCEKNYEYDWLIVTDDRTQYEYPENVHVQYTDFDEFVKRVQSHFDFQIALRYPYKICDFRPAFGQIFEKELKEYRFWGHCDLDQYFGRISAFITDDILDSYDKILCLGHFTLFRNIPQMNSLYMITDVSIEHTYRDVFSNEGHWIFDEWPKSGSICINRLVKHENIKTYYCNDCFCDLIPFKSRFQRYIFDEMREDWDIEPVNNMIFVWEEGRLFSCHINKGELVKREMLYVHIRQRKIDISAYDERKGAFYLIPNKLISDEIANPAIYRYIKNAWCRGLLYPDELSRKKVVLRGYWNAIKRRLLTYKR